MKKRSTFTVLLFLLTLRALAGGFQLNLQGLRQLAMGGGGTGWTWDASTIFYNPGGITHMNGMQAYAGVIFLSPHTRYVQTPTGNYTADAQSHLYTPFNVYVGGPLKKNSKIGLGLAVYTPFGSGIKWDDDWAGRYVIQEIQLQSIFVQPTVSYGITDKLSAGVGFIYGFGSILLRQALPVADANGNEGEAKLQGAAGGFGFNAGLHYRFSPKVQAGISYRSQVNMKVNNGKATFTVPSSLAGQFPNTTFKSGVKLPSVLSVGVGVRPVKALTLQFDVNYVGWKSYDSLGFDFAQETDNLKDNKQPRLYKSVAAFRLGANYSFGKLAVMLGGAYDPTPAHDGYISPDLPDANRIVLNGGLSYSPMSKLNIIVALEYQVIGDHVASYDPANFSGKYQAKAAIPGIGITYDF
jgi:long-chain fatty acid transport protein